MGQDGSSGTRAPGSDRGEATSAARSAPGEVLRAAAGAPADGFALDDCVEVLGDDLERSLRWQDAPGLHSLAGEVVRLRFVMADADLYWLRFR